MKILKNSLRVGLVLIIFITTTQLKAQGPNAPEAASFEPVDATDMVNLVTGDFTYVLPLLNVPSPEGGYPISLSYHAGIAMEQEASWVGLGWSLNPGAINRSVNGVPDDWAKTDVSELFYDQGGSTDYYSFSIGGTLPNGVTLGISKSWGGYRGWGGVIGYGGFNLNFDSEGDITAGQRLALGPMSLGLSSNSSKLLSSVGLKLGGTSMGFNTENNSFSISVKSKANGLGISFNSNDGSLGLNYGAKNSSFSSSTTSQSITKNDYNFKIKDKGFNLDVGFFWVSYRHRNVSYSLFKNNVTYHSGILNMYDNNVDSSVPHDDGTYGKMDIKEFYADNDDIGNNFDDPYSFSLQPAITLPNYDNYLVSGHGIGGSITPKIYQQLTLKGKNYFKSTPSNNGGQRVRYFNNDNLNVNEFVLNDKIYFYFDNTNSSFLRDSYSNFVGPNTDEYGNPTYDPNNYYGYNNLNINNLNDVYLYDTAYDQTYSSQSTIEGFLKKEGNRKRDGNFIETFTNNDIINNNTNGWFIESRGYDRNNNSNRVDLNEVDEGIGAYRITLTDGKVYHYSQPVYHYESIYKNFPNGSNENSKFFRSKKVRPYATHWLLTAITGPDYVDSNNNGILDESDYGYWVEFEYGKWSDGFGWRTPREGFKVMSNNNSYFLGIKQVYYLDKIKTRTHTALFIKSIREDNKSFPINILNSQWSNNSGNSVASALYSETFYDTEDKQVNLNGPYYVVTPGTNVNESFTNLNNYSFSGRKGERTYLRMPENYSLKLDKIILLKNEDAIYDKSLSDSESYNNLIGHTFHTRSVSNYGGVTQIFFDKPYSNAVPNRYDINLNDNILEENDLNLQTIEDKAIKTINFSFDYSLSNNLPNSSAGHLTLNELSFSGKSNINIIPPYKFDYTKKEISYQQDNQDVWGYVNNDPDAWSLNKITTPIGGVIKVDYESDSFNKEAAFRTPNTFKHFYFTTKGHESYQDDVNILDISVTGNYLYIYYDTDIIGDISQIATLGEEVDINLVTAYSYDTDPNTVNVNNYKWNGNKYSLYNYSVNAGYIIFKTNQNTDMNRHYGLFNLICPIMDPPTSAYSQSTYIPQTESEHCISSISFYLDQNLLTANDPNGKKGGGVRVKSIKVGENENTLNYVTSYNYIDPETNKISGVTSYEPFDDENKIVPYIEQIPSPNVLYKNVKVTNLSNNLVNNSSLYEFKTLESFNLSNSDSDILYALGSDFFVTRSQYLVKGGTDSYILANAQNKDYKMYKHTIHDNLNNIGQLLSVKTINSDNQVIQVKSNDFKRFDANTENHDFGISQESFKTIKEWYGYGQNAFQSNVYGQHGFNIGSSSVINYPSIIESYTYTNNGYSFTEKITQRDFLSGQVVEKESIDSRGHRLKSKIVPAYTIMDYNPIDGYGMGSKVDNITNKNMLSQTSINITFMESNNNWEKTGVGITTWSNEWSYANYHNAFAIGESQDYKKIWRRHKKFVWNGDINNQGFYQGFIGNDDNFNWEVGSWPNGTTQTNSKWKNISTTTRYDHYSMPLEVKDINNNYAITKMCDNDSKVLFTANSNYNESFYSGVENQIDPHYSEHGVQGAEYRSDEASHTGKFSIKLPTNIKGFRTTLKSGFYRTGIYKISVWVNKDGYENLRLNINSQTKSFNGESVVAGDWVMLNHYEEFNTSQTNTVSVLTLGELNYVDDFRVHPIETKMTSYVYNQWDELEAIIGSNNLATKFEYDSQGRLIFIYTETIENQSIAGGFIKSKEYLYDYAHSISNIQEGTVIGGNNPSEVAYSDVSACISDMYSNPITTGSSVCTTGNQYTKTVGLNTYQPQVGSQIIINGEYATKTIVESNWGTTYFDGGIRWIRFVSGDYNTIWDVDPNTGVLLGISSYSCQ